MYNDLYVIRYTFCTSIKRFYLTIFSCLAISTKHFSLSIENCGKFAMRSQQKRMQIIQIR